MARFVGKRPAADGVVLDDSPGLWMTLVLGPDPAVLGEFSDEELSAAWWGRERGPCLQHCRDTKLGLRWMPWAWWRFEAREERPSTDWLEHDRLIELGVTP